MQDMSAKINISNESIQLDGFIHDTVDYDEINKIEYLDDFEIHGGKKEQVFRIMDIFPAMQILKI